MRGESHPLLLVNGAGVDIGTGKQMPGVGTIGIDERADGGASCRAAADGIGQRRGTIEARREIAVDQTDTAIVFNQDVVVDVIVQLQLEQLK